MGLQVIEKETFAMYLTGLIGFLAGKQCCILDVLYMCMCIILEILLYIFTCMYIIIYIRTYVYLKYVKIIYCMRWYWYILFQYIDSSKIYHQYCPLSSAILLWNITMMICQGTIGCTPNSVPMVLIGLI